MKAAINFEDSKDGAVNVMLYLEGSTDLSSGAHRMAVQVLKYIENHAERLSDPVTETHPLEDVVQGMSANPLVIH